MMQMIKTNVNMTLAGSRIILSEVDEFCFKSVSFAVTDGDFKSKIRKYVAKENLFVVNFNSWNWNPNRSV